MPDGTSRLALLFDLDGTLIDSIGLLVASMEHAYAGRPIQPPRDEWIAMIGTPLDAALRRWATDDADVEALRERYREFQFANHDAMTTAYPGVIDTIRALRDEGHALAVVTSKLSRGARKSLEYIGIADCFDVVVGLESTATHKPGPEPVRYALAQLGGIAPSRALFVGDSTHDMHAGRAADVTTAAATWGPFSRAQLATAHPDHWLERIEDVRGIVTRLAMM